MVLRSKFWDKIVSKWNKQTFAYDHSRANENSPEPSQHEPYNGGVRRRGVLDAWQIAVPLALSFRAQSLRHSHVESGINTNGGIGEANGC